MKGARGTVAKSARKSLSSPRKAAKPAVKKTAVKATKLNGKKPAKLITVKAARKGASLQIKHPAIEKLVRKVDRNEHRRTIDSSINVSFSAPSPVATNLKPRKNQAGMLTKELEHFRDLLLEKRREIVGDMSSMEREALRSGSGSNLSTLPIHMADMGTDNYEQEFTLGLVEKDRNLLREINNALAKIQNGAYGMCEGTGKPIAKARLEAQPWARFSIDYARKIEKGVMGVR
jgi:DnaK suppressor protein